MAIVRNIGSEANEGINEENRVLVDAFCALVDDKELWYLVTTVVREFRLSFMEQ